MKLTHTLLLALATVALASCSAEPSDWRPNEKVSIDVIAPGTRPTEDALRRFVLDNGPAYAHPRAVWFVDELPLAGTNKIDRKALVDRAAATYARENGRRV